MALFLGFGSLLVLWLGSRDVIRGRITLGEFVAFNAYLAMLAWPMIAFGWVTNMLQRGLASWKRMLEVLDAQPAIDDARLTPAGRPRDRGAIEFRDLTFAYPAADRPVLRRRVAPASSRADGRVRRRDRLGQVDADQPAAAAARSAARHGVHRRHRRARDPARRLRGAIGFVPQEPFLFSDTMAEHRVRRGPRRATATTADRRSRAARGGGRAARQGRRATSRRATTRWSASAASRCRAGRSSGPRSRAPRRSIRAS